MFNGLLHVLLEPGTDAQDGHAVAAGQLHGRCARELVLGVDEAEAACIGHVLVPQVLHGPAEHVIFPQQNEKKLQWAPPKFTVLLTSAQQK